LIVDMVDEELIAILSQAGRLRFGALRKMAIQKTAVEFTRMFLFPVFVGSELYRGTLGTGEGDGSTVHFSVAAPAEEQEAFDSSDLQRAIFPLVHKPDTRSTLDTFTIGRDGLNDMILADSAVSRQHASITVEHGRLLLRDLGSRNGTRLNGRPLTSRRFERFNAGDEVTFARFKFAVVSPSVLYLNLRYQDAKLE
jgi:hypothetical protein